MLGTRYQHGVSISSGKYYARICSAFVHVDNDDSWIGWVPVWVFVSSSFLESNILVVIIIH